MVPVGSKTNISNSTNFYALLESLVRAGFDEEEISDSAEAFEGMKAHIVRVKQQSRGEDFGGKEVTVVSEIHDLPYEDDGASKSKKKKRTKPAKASAKPKQEEEDEEEGETSDDELQEKIVAIVEANGGTISKQVLGRKMFQELKTDKSIKSKERNDLVQQALDEEWLGDDERPWTFDGAEIELTDD